MNKSAPCTCIVMPGAVKVTEVIDPFCPGDFTHRVMGSTEEDPMYGLDIEAEAA